MRTILLFNDNSAEAENAAEYTFELAQRVGADILVLNLVKQQQLIVVAAKNKGNIDQLAHEAPSALVDHLLSRPAAEFRPAILEVEASEMTVKDIASFIIQKDIWMMVKGIEQHHISHKHLTDIDVQAVLNRVACPLLLVPNKYRKKNFENITYAVDMRYCRAVVLRFLTELANIYQANFVVEHFSAKGLPPLDDKYAISLFDSEIAPKVKCDKLFFNNIKERNIDIAIDVMVNGLHTDLLALVNHRFHFAEIFGTGIKDVMPQSLPVPVIVFPL